MPEEIMNEEYVAMDFEAIEAEDEAKLRQYDRTVNSILAKMELDLGICL